MTLLIQTVTATARAVQSSQLTLSPVPKELPVGGLAFGHSCGLELLLDRIDLIFKVCSRRRRQWWMITARPLTDLVIEHIGTLVLRAIRLVGKVADADATIVVPLTRALVSLCITARPLTDFVIKYTRTAVLDRRVVAEPLDPAV